MTRLGQRGDRIRRAVLFLMTFLIAWTFLLPISAGADYDVDLACKDVHTVVEIPEERDICKEDSISQEPVEQAPVYTEEEIRLIALLTMAEAGNQSELGKRLVIDVILNRVDHPSFPNSVHGVIYQKNQFSPIWNGAIERCEVTEENLQLVREEIESRTDHEIIFFRAGRYGDYGVPMYCVGDHYFSSYD